VAVQKPKVARPGRGGCRGLGNLVRRAVRRGRGSLAGLVEGKIDLRQREAGQRYVELEINQGLQLKCQDLGVPAGIERELVAGQHIGARSSALKCESRTVGTAASPNSLAAMTRPWPAMISPAWLIKTGLVKPKRLMLSAIWHTCFLECRRALPG
jgi:hypothetical protein